jgi:hypothetical protein
MSSQKSFSQVDLQMGSRMEVAKEEKKTEKENNKKCLNKQGLSLQFRHAPAEIGPELGGNGACAYFTSACFQHG